MSAVAHFVALLVVVLDLVVHTISGSVVLTDIWLRERLQDRGLTVPTLASRISADSDPVILIAFVANGLSTCLVHGDSKDQVVRCSRARRRLAA